MSGNPALRPLVSITLHISKPKLETAGYTRIEPTAKVRMEMLSVCRLSAGRTHCSGKFLPTLEGSS